VLTLCICVWKVTGSHLGRVAASSTAMFLVSLTLSLSMSRRMLGSYLDYLFVYSLFNDAFSSSDHISSDYRMIVNNELERTSKEAAVA
jgi:hypothetical protein